MVMLALRPLFCDHLDPLVAALAAAGVRVGLGKPCPYDPEFGTFHRVDCSFDEPSLRRRLGLDDCVSYDEYEQRVSPGEDATFYCHCCRVGIVGRHPLAGGGPAGTVG